MTTCNGLLSRNATKKHNDALAPNIESRFPSSLVDFYRLNVLLGGKKFVFIMLI
jgi:hypothetical protein